MFRNRSVDVHDMAMIPRSDVPRSSFRMPHGHKTTFDAGFLVPVYVNEVLPGDTFKVRATMFARMSTPLFPVMDNLHLESFFFFVPARLVWTNFVKMMGEQDNPADSISFVVPQVVSPVGGYAVGGLQDHFGLPTVGQVGGAATVSVNSLPLRAYNMIFNEWFRDENLQNSVVENVGNGPDTAGGGDYTMLRRGKRRDYFTSCLPWTQKGGVAVNLPLGTSAPVKSDGTTIAIRGGVGALTNIVVPAAAGNLVSSSASALGNANFGAVGTSTTGLFADLTGATAATINDIRQAFQIQRFLEKDARGGTRYSEKIQSHFGVTSPDARLQRPEYLGGGSQPITVNPVAQTSGTSATGTTTPLGNLAAVATSIGTHGFTQSFVEHGYIIGLVSVRADLSYQQGLRKLWSRSTQYDFYWPVFQALGEQAVLNREIYCDGSANDATVFGYNERWAEYRYHPSLITGLFRSTSAGTIDPWHLAQKFTALPTLNTTFIQDTPPVSRVVAVGAAANGQQFIFDSYWDDVVTRPLPMYSVPGMVDHF